MNPSAAATLDVNDAEDVEDADHDVLYKIDHG